MLGCGGGDTEGNADYRQNFDKPSVEGKVAPVEKPLPYKKLSPREKKALKKSE